MSKNPRVLSKISSKQNTPKTHINQSNKDKTQRANIKISTGKATSNIQWYNHKDNRWCFSRNSSGQKGMVGYALSDEREKPTTKSTPHSMDFIQIWRNNQKLYKLAKAEKIQHHQTSSSTNAKGSSLDRKHRKSL